jgi:hypothetical protein
MSCRVNALLPALGVLMLSACTQETDVLFTSISPEVSNVSFVNEIVETPEINILSYEYTYNGGGVAAGDFNNDGRCDLYFSGNTVSNKLYLNQGNFIFEDVTEKAGVAGRGLWKTGVTAVDVNADGWLDIYVCYSGPDLKQSFSNQLFVSNGIRDGVLTFTDRAVEYGLDAPGTFSTQSAFFDYDRDGDLDMFLLNHGNHFFSPFVNTNKLRNTRHPQFGNRLYRNDSQLTEDKMAFTEVSDQAGIHGGGINFGLGVSISDFNNDNWPDIYVTNDYEEQDFLYLNNKNGTFTECSKKSFGHFSRNGMGTDVADYNNDGRQDLIEVDMWPEDNYRQKLLKGPDNFSRYQLMLDSGFHHQQMRNTLQLNSGVNPQGIPVFIEIGQLAGVSSTDWSWAPLFLDADNDGNKDLFVTNGYLRDFTSQDFLKFTVEKARQESKQQGLEFQVFDLVSKMASTKTYDYLFQNNGDLTFSDKTEEWGLSIPNLSFGAAYADLDSDGDFELITNNTNEPASIWKNNSNEIGKKNYLSVKLNGLPLNTHAIGAKVWVTSNGTTQMLEQYPTRGFQSSVEPILHFGLGSDARIDLLKVLWPDGKVSTLDQVSANQRISIEYTSAQDVQGSQKISATLFEDYTQASSVQFTHRENSFVDYHREPLLLYQLSKLGPALASADVNGDGLDDFFVGGAIGQSGQLFVGTEKGQFIPHVSQPWTADQRMEDVSALFFDVEGDEDSDLFVVSGGNEYETGSPFLDDRLYLNDGKGNFIKAPEGSTIADHANGSCVTAGDYDKDGDFDLFVGGSSMPGFFPQTNPGAILRNDSDKTSHVIKFTVATNDVNPDLRQPGIVTDALWTDFNNDTWPDLIVIGEWMSPRLFVNQQGKLVELKNENLTASSGLWCRIVASDLDKDGDLDYVLGNAGLNLPWRVSTQKPLLLYSGDFNDDGKLDPLVFYTQQGKQFPVASRDEMLQQLPPLRKKFTSYADYAKATVTDILDGSNLNRAEKLSITMLESCVLINKGDNEFELKPLPLPAQISTVRGIVTNDFNRDGVVDILTAGNFSSFQTQMGPANASFGLLLMGSGANNFDVVDWNVSGFYSPGYIHNMKLLNGSKGERFIVQGRNNESVALFKIVQK